jgi:selenocysteine lyase/cysteine desulfurase
VETLPSFRQGGTGTLSENDHQPTQGFEKYESGSLNLPGIAGLEAGLDYLQDNASQLLENKQRLTKTLLEGLLQIPSIAVYGDLSADNRVAVVSFNLGDLDCHELAMLLESQAHIQVRAGLHCAPQMHQALETASRGGTVRVSLGPFNTEEHIERLLSTLKTLVTAVRSGSR